MSADVKYTIKIKTSKRILTTHYFGINSPSKVMAVAQRMVYEQLYDNELKNFSVSIIKQKTR
jgi:hypothetical protein